MLKNLPFDPGSYHGYGIHDFLAPSRASPTCQPRPTTSCGRWWTRRTATGLYVIFDIVLNHTGDVFAYQGAGQPRASIPPRSRSSGGTGSATPAPSSRTVEAIPAARRSADALVWPAELQENRFFRRQGGPQDGGDDTVGDFASLKQMLTADPDLQAS